jgi:predicted amidohydrolase
MITLAIAQTRPVYLDPAANHAAALDLIRSVEADVYLLPELYLSGYAFSSNDEVREVALSPDNPYFDELEAFSAERGCAICGGYAEAGADDPGGETARAGGDVFNSAFFIGDGKLLANYRKSHLFYREKEFFTPGDTGFIVVEYRGVQFGIMVCFDWIFPESARTLALAGAQVILHPANLVLPWCQRAMFARAVENRVFIATANRVGRETNAQGDDLTFTGQSQAVTPEGEYVLEFTDREVGIRTVRIVPGEADQKLLNQFNDVLADRRPDMYRPLRP